MNIKYSFPNTEKEIEISQTKREKASSIYRIKLDNIVLGIYDEDRELMEFLEFYGSKLADSESSFDFAKRIIDSGFDVESIEYNNRNIANVRAIDTYSMFERLVSLADDVPSENSVNVTAYDNEYYYDSFYNDRKKEHTFAVGEQGKGRVATYTYNEDEGKINTQLSEKIKKGQLGEQDFIPLHISNQAHVAFEDHIYKVERNREMMEQERIKGAKEKKRLMDTFRRGLDRITDWVKEKKHKIEDNFYESQIDRLKEKTWEKERAFEERKSRRGDKKARSKGFSKTRKREYVDVEFSKNGDTPVINITRNRNGLVESLTVEYDGKELSHDSEFYKKLMNTRTPADVMEVLHEQQLDVKRLDVSLTSNMPEIVAPMTTVLKDNLAHYGFDGVANIEVTAKTKDVELTSTMNLHNGQIKKWDLNELDKKTEQKAFLVIGEDGYVKNEENVKNSVALNEASKYAFLYSKNNIQREEKTQNEEYRMNGKDSKEPEKDSKESKKEEPDTQKAENDVSQEAEKEQEAGKENKDNSSPDVSSSDTEDKADEGKSEKNPAKSMDIDTLVSKFESSFYNEFRNLDKAEYFKDMCEKYNVTPHITQHPEKLGISSTMKGLGMTKAKIMAQMLNDDSYYKEILTDTEFTPKDIIKNLEKWQTEDKTDPYTRLLASASTYDMVDSYCRENVKAPKEHNMEINLELLKSNKEKAFEILKEKYEVNENNELMIDGGYFAANVNNIAKLEVARDIESFTRSVTNEPEVKFSDDIGNYFKEEVIDIISSENTVLARNGVDEFLEKKGVYTFEDTSGSVRTFTQHEIEEFASGKFEKYDKMHPTLFGGDKEERSSENAVEDVMFGFDENSFNEDSFTDEDMAEALEMERQENKNNAAYRDDTPDV